MEAAKQQVDDLLAAKRQNPTPQEVVLQNEIAALSAKEQEAATRLAAATTRVLELEERIRSIQEGQSLARFLAERTRSEDYRKHLGLISTIRQDFESLGMRLAGGQADSGGSLRPVDRIILYIDDLDRCPADKVMDVLQAVHLLLAYPLFVVVVGVDPRWLLHSLGTTYSAFQTDGDHNSINPDMWRTTPQNYLEKIFQIPFSLRRMSATGYGKLIEGLLSPALMQKFPDTPEEPKRAPVPSPLPDAPADAPIPDDDQASDSTPAPEPGNTPHESQTEGVAEKTKFVINEESLVIKPWEAKFAEGLFALIPTPRAAKRFSNVYRILKAPVRRERLAQFEGTKEIPGDFQVPMLLLAILIGASTEGATLFPKLQQHAANGNNVIEALQRFGVLGPEFESPTFKALEKKISLIIAESRFPSAPEVFLYWIPRVSRFSFELGRVVQPVAAAPFRS